MIESRSRSMSFRHTVSTTRPLCGSLIPLVKASVKRLRRNVG